MPTSNGIKMEIIIKVKYDFGTFERSKISATIDITKSIIKIGTIIAVSNIARY